MNPIETFAVTASAVVLALAAAAPAPAQHAPFEPPIPVAGIHQAGSSDRSPTLTFTKLQMAFASDRPGGQGGYDLYVATRPDLATPFGTPRPVDGRGINGPGDQLDPELNPIGNELYFASNIAGNLDLFVATRVWDDDPFAPPVPLVQLNSPFNDSGPALAADELEIVFVSDRLGGPFPRTLWRAVRQSASAPWGQPQPIGELDGPGEEHSPSLSRDGTTLLFTANRPGGPGGDDVWVATRPNRGAPFAPPVPVAELSTPTDDQGFRLCYDGYTVFGAQTAGGESSIVMADLDEPILESLTEPEVGEPWQIWVRSAPGSTAFVFLAFGAGPPISIPGIEGTFELDLGSMLLVHTGVCDKFETTVAHLPIPNQPALEGVDLHFQAFVERPTDGWWRKFTKRWKRQIRKLYAKLNACKDERNRCFTGCQQQMPSIIDQCTKRNLYMLYYGPQAYGYAVWQCVKSQAISCSKRCLWQYSRCLLH